MFPLAGEIRVEWRRIVGAVQGRRQLKITGRRGPPEGGHYAMHGAADASAAMSTTASSQSGVKPMAVRAGAISGFAMKRFHTSPVRWFSIMTTMGAWFRPM